MAARGAGTAVGQDASSRLPARRTASQVLRRGLPAGLREQGLIEGQNIAIEWGLASGVAQLPDALAKLTRLKVDVVLGSGTSAVLLTRDAAGTIPVVFVAAVDPVAMGLVPRLARPSRTVTGFTTEAEELNGKRLQLMQQMIPNLSTVAFLVRADSPATTEHTKLAEHAAKTLGVRLHVIAVRDQSEFETAVSVAKGAGALLVVDDSVFTAQRTKIAELALKNQLPTMYGHRDMVQAGGLMTYGPDYGDPSGADLEEMLKLQTDYVRSQIAALTEQAQDLGKLTSHLGTTGSKKA